MEDDALGQYLAHFRVRSVASGLVRARGAWALQVAEPRGFKFWGVLEGRAFYRVGPAGEVGDLAPGDCLLLSRRTSLVLATDFAAPRQRLEDVQAGRLDRGSGEEFRMVGGEVLLEGDETGDFLAGLPTLWRWRPEPGDAAGDPGWLLRALTLEQTGTLPGAGQASVHLAQLLFLWLVRAHLRSGEGPGAGWLRLAADPRLAPVARAIHERPEAPWSLEGLASMAALSRAAFAARFREVSGTTPLAYVTRWRMRLARRELREGRATLADLALRLGYGSEAAFSAAFRREVGRAPGAWRAAARRSAGG